ncbi:MAG: hypothetical protein IV100_26085 [Myxococcales bacterium]|nr:hypothetical protein [Myxococcales bacterium]
MLRSAFAALLLVAALPGCTNMFTEIAANQTTNVMKKAVKSFDSEPDPWLAYHAALGQLKFAEGVLEAAPENADLMVLISRNYAQFSYSFIQDELDQATPLSAEAEALEARAVSFLKRARSYAVRRLALDFDDAPRAVFASGDRFDQILAECNADEHGAALYWLAFAWGNLITVDADNPDHQVDLPRVKKIMGWVRERLPDFDEGGAHLFFGTIGSALPKSMGGDPEEAKKSFEAAIAVTGGRYLMAKVMYARHYSRAVNDRRGYRTLLQDVLDAPDDIMSERQLANTLAKKRAARWLAETDKHFDTPDRSGAK